MALRVSRMALVLGLWCGQVCAQGTEAPPPDPALLEFLGEWDDGAGSLVDWEMLDDAGDTRAGAVSDGGR